MLIDTHCHLADEAFVEDVDAVVARARAAGVSAALCILAAGDEAESRAAAAAAAAWPELRLSTGIHPHGAAAWAGRFDEARRVLEASMATHGAVAVGEIGLDYHYDFAPKAVQREIFGLQVDVAAAAGTPVVIHARESMDDTLAILAAASRPVRGVMHCFTGTVDEARRSLDLGFYISLSGIVTFPRSADLRAVARFVPADRLLIETDAPFLAPVPHRGRRNEPAWIVETFGVLTELRAVPADDLMAQLAANTAALIPALASVPLR